MAKKLKYPYEQWKEQQNKPNSRSPSPMEAVDDEGFSSSSSSPQSLIPHGAMSPRSDYPEAFAAAAARHAIYGKWCSMLHVERHKIYNLFTWYCRQQSIICKNRGLDLVDNGHTL